LEIIICFFANLIDFLSWNLKKISMLSFGAVLTFMARFSIHIDFFRVHFKKLCSVEIVPFVRLSVPLPFLQDDPLQMEFLACFAPKFSDNWV
jgi:hypothetical protein